MRALGLALTVVCLSACSLGFAENGALAPASPPQPPINGAEETIRSADADMGAVLRQLVGLGAQPFERLSPQQARQQATPADAVRAVMMQRGMSTAPEPVASTRDFTYPGASGPMAARIYMPRTALPGALPVVLYFHGGGWVVADLDTYDASARAIANSSGAMVVSAHYRQGPEYRFPAAHEDAWAAYQWLATNAAAIGADPARIAVAGESAGANLAMNVAIRARDTGVRLPVHQVLIYPVAGSSTNTTSYIENQGAVPLGRGGMEWFFANYLASPTQRDDPRINLVAANVQGLPPTTLVLAAIDPLQTEGRALGARLTAARVPVEMQVYEGVTHEFFGMAPVVADARAAQAFVGERLRTALAPRLALR